MAIKTKCIVILVIFMRRQAIISILILISLMFSGCTGEKTINESGFITEGWTPIQNESGSEVIGTQLPTIHTFTIDAGEKVNIDSAVVTLNLTVENENVVFSDSMIFTISCDDGTEFISQMASPLPSGSSKCEVVVTNTQNVLEDHTEVHSISWSLTYTII